LSPDGQLLATVESTPEYDSRLVVLDESSGRNVKTFAATENTIVSMPRWSGDGQSIVALHTKAGKRSVVAYRMEGNQTQELFPPSEENIGHPVLHGKYLFFNSPYSGIDNIYVLDITAGKRYQVTSSKYGSYNPAISPDGDWIFYNEQTRDGMDVVKVAFEPTFWVPLEDVAVRRLNVYDPVIEQEGHPKTLENIPDKKYPASRYNKLAHMVNIHSWGPYFNTNVTTATIGVFSKDILSYTMIEAGYEFDLYERTGLYKGAISYQGLYPVIDAEAIYGKRVVNTSVDDRDIQFKWTETGGAAGIRLPFLLTNGKNHTSLTLKNAVGVTQVSDFSSQTVKENLIIGQGTSRRVRINDSLSFIFSDRVGNGRLIYNRAVLGFSRYWRTSHRDINPRWGQLIDIEAYSTPFKGSDFSGHLTAVRGVFYFPGFVKHHSFFARLGYQTGTQGRDVNRYAFRNSIFRPRGFNYPRDSEFLTLSGNYTMPVWYPDISLGPLVHFQRIRTNLFYDYGEGVGRNYFYADNGQVYYSNASNIYQSTGIEVTFDINVMRLLPQLDIGFRFTKGISEKEDVMFEFLLGSLNF
jgi:hypothetical protein